jgi:hypothetical protein
MTTKIRNPMVATSEVSKFTMRSTFAGELAGASGTLPNYSVETTGMQMWKAVCYLYGMDSIMVPVPCLTRYRIHVVSGFVKKHFFAFCVRG